MEIENYFFDLTKDYKVDYPFSGILCLDRDGVIIQEKNYLKDPNEIEFIEGSIAAIKKIIKSNLFIAVVSNQAGIAKGLISETDFRNVNNKFIDLLRENNALVHCLLYCPYNPLGVVKKYRKDSIYRKPATGMYNYIRRYYNLQPMHKYIVGDKKTDIDFGRNIDAKCILVDTGYGSSEKNSILETYTEVVNTRNLLEAVKWIIQNNKKST